MPERTPTYRVDESLLREKMHNYRVEVDPARCEAIDREAANIRFKKSFRLPAVNLRIVVPAVLAVILVIVLAFNFNSLTSFFTSGEEEPPVQEKTLPQPNTTPSVAVEAETIATPTPATSATNSVVVSPAKPDQAPVIQKKEEDTAQKRADSSTRDSNAKKAEPVVAQPPTDTAAKTNEAKQDSVQNDEPAKKKKKRRRRDRSMDELKESTLQPSSTDDDVVVPQ
jgi:hypothetical protein